MSSVFNNKKRKFQRILLRWYEKKKRRFSWRDPNRNSYEILIAEMMLRKTDTAKVAQIYDSFIKKYRSPKSLALSRESSLRHDIRLLGIADIARLFRLLGRKIVKECGGQIPKSFQELTGLPGVGRYTANAVLCFAFRRDVALLDTNVIRVLGRVFSVYSSKLRARDDPVLWDFATTIVPKGKATSYNRALLDFDAQVCTLTNPKCLTCALCGICDYARANAKDCKE